MTEETLRKKLEKLLDEAVFDLGFPPVVRPPEVAAIIALIESESVEAYKRGYIDAGLQSLAVYQPTTEEK